MFSDLHHTMSDDHDAKPDIKPAVYTTPFPPGEEEELTLAPNMANHNVWALKVPRFVLEQWEQITQPGIELGSLIVDNSLVSLKHIAETRLNVVPTHLPSLLNSPLPIRTIPRNSGHG